MRFAEAERRAAQGKDLAAPRTEQTLRDGPQSARASEGSLTNPEARVTAYFRQQGVHPPLQSPHPRVSLQSPKLASTSLWRQQDSQSNFCNLRLASAFRERSERLALDLRVPPQFPRSCGRGSPPGREPPSPSGGHGEYLPSRTGFLPLQKSLFVRCWSVL